MSEKLEQEKTLCTTPRDLNDYVGTYGNILGTTEVNIFLQDKNLAMRFQDLEEETFAMEHCECDTFRRWFTRDECARRGMLTNCRYEYFRINFAWKAGMIDCWKWKTTHHNRNSPQCLRECLSEYRRLRILSSIVVDSIVLRYILVLVHLWVRVRVRSHLSIEMFLEPRESV